MAVPLKSCIAPSFYEAHHHIKTGAFNEFWLAGGRGSTKSSFTAMEIVLGVVNDPNASAICFRKVADTIRGSLGTTFSWAIEKLQLSMFFKQTNSPAEFTYTPTGQQIILKGLDDRLKLKSIKPKVGYFKFVWFEELEEYDGMAEIRNVLQSVKRGGDTFVTFMTYNPPQDPNSWVNTENEMDPDTFELKSTDPDRYVHQSTYLDVPPEWVGIEFIREAEKLKEKDRDAYDHEYLGRAIGNVERLVFFGRYEVRNFETPNTDQMYQGRFFYGLDWGFSQDPLACLRCFIVGNTLYIDYETGGIGLELDKTAPKLKKDIPDISRWKVYADNSRPESISLVSRLGNLDIQGAPKWKGSVEDGIEYLKKFDNIVIHPRCKRVILEFKRYSYKVDRHTKEILATLVDKHNHFIDALRYALADYIKSVVSILDAL